MGRYITTLEKEEKQQGLHVVAWNPDNLPSGVYICILENKSDASRKRIKILKE